LSARGDTLFEWPRYRNAPKIKLALNKLHQRIRKKLLAHYNRLWKTELSNTSDNNRNGRVSYWKFIRKYENQARLPLPTMRDGNTVAENDAEKATLIVDHFAAQCLPPAYIVAGRVLYDSHRLADAEERFELFIIVESERILTLYQDKRRLAPSVSPT
jgi:hypothetical protein